MTGQDIRDLRLAWGMNKRQFGEMIGCDYYTVSHWEEGGKIYKLKHQERLAEISATPLPDHTKAAKDAQRRFWNKLWGFPNAV